MRSILIRRYTRGNFKLDKLGGGGDSLGRYTLKFSHLDIYESSKITRGDFASNLIDFNGRRCKCCINIVRYIVCHDTQVRNRGLFMLCCQAISNSSEYPITNRSRQNGCGALSRNFVTIRFFTVLL